MALSQQRTERAALIADVEQMTGTRVVVRSFSDRDTVVMLQGGNSRLMALRMRAVPNDALRTARDLIAGWK